MKLPGKFAIIAVAAAIAAPQAFADGHAKLPPSVKARQAHMQLYAHNLGALGAMAKGEAEYDAEAAQAAANNIVALANLNQASYWPAGTSRDEVEGSKALAAIWEDFPGVMEKSGAFVEAAQTMAAEAGNGLEAVQAAIGPLGKGCGGCHEDYRHSDN